MNLKRTTIGNKLV